jgi:glycosyltransferase involved in cell wall biosynthesis
MHPANNSIELTVVLCAYNEKNHISHAISSLHEEIGNNMSVELIIIDNESEDDTYKIAKAVLDELKFDNAIVFSIIHCPLTSSRNTGLQKARGRYISYVDADGYVKSGWYESLKKAINDDVDIFCGSVGIDPCVSGFSKFIYELHYKPSLGVAEVPLIGANMCFRTDLIKSVGGFHNNPSGRGDETLLLYILSKSVKDLIIKSDNSSIVINSYASNLFSWLKIQFAEGKSAGFTTRVSLVSYILGYIFRSANIYLVPLCAILVFLGIGYFYIPFSLFLIRHFKRWDYYKKSLSSNKALRTKPKELFILLLGSIASDLGYICNLVIRKPILRRSDVSKIIRSYQYD